MSAHARAESWEHSRTTTRAAGHDSVPARWTAEEPLVGSFAEEQMRGLVAKVFLADQERAARHVLLGAVDSETQSWELSTQLGLALARETIGTVLVARGDVNLAPAAKSRTSVRESCLRLGPNLWMLPDAGDDGTDALPPLAYQTDALLQQVRREFDYSILHVAWSRLLSEATRLGKASDGLILTLGTGTRRVVARRMRQSLAVAGVPLIGAVLTGRTFPVPEGVYRRL